MAHRKRPFVIGTAALMFFFMIAITATPAAQARRAWGRGRTHVGAVVGAVIADAILGATIYSRVVAPPLYLEFHGYPAAPPPCCYAPPPPAYVYAQPVHLPPPSRLEQPRFGLAFSGLVQAPPPGELAIGGVAGALQFRTSSHSLLMVEVQSLAARRVSDGARRNDFGVLLGGRVFPWNWVLAPYLELAAGAGRASYESDRWNVRASQLVGRVGLGLELRLGRHVVLEGQVASVHRLLIGRDSALVTTGSLDDLNPAPAPVGNHQRAVELRGGLALRF